MPYRDPAWWARLFEHAPEIAGGLIAALLHLMLALAAPRPYPPGFWRATLVQAAAAWLLGILAAVFIGPLIAHFFKVSAPEAVGGIKTIVGVVAWKALPGLQTAAETLIRRKSESV
jgi:hypothetical protein